MKLSYTLILFFIINIAKAQKTITVLSADDHMPLSNVLIYHKTNLIGETNKEGKAVVQLNNVDSLVFVKNDYEDIILAKAQLTEIIKMTKNRVIFLKEVIVTPMTAEILLKKVGEFMKAINMDGTKRNSPNYIVPYNLQIYNKFMAGNDTLHYLNNRFTFEKGNFKINDQTKIVKNFKQVQVKENIVKIYHWNNKETDFWDSFWLTPLGVNYSVDFTDFFYNQGLFDYKIVASNDYYRLEFVQKKKGRFSIQGYMIVDKGDFGIYEFEAHLLNDQPRFVKHVNFSNSNLMLFKVYTDTYRFRYIKENDIYILDYSSKNTKFTEEKGEYKNIQFTNTIQVERTIDFAEKNLKSFDAFKWTIK